MNKRQFTLSDGGSINVVMCVLGNHGGASTVERGGMPSHTTGNMFIDIRIVFMEQRSDWVGQRQVVIDKF